MAFLYVCYGYKVGKMANIEIKDGEYTKTIYSMIKEQRYDHFRLGTTASKKKKNQRFYIQNHFIS